MWIKNWKSYQKASLRLHTCHIYQLSHVTPSFAIPLAVCILILPLLVVVNEHVQLTMSEPTFQCGHMTLNPAPLVLPSLHNVLPAMALQNRVARLNTGYASCLSFHSSVQCASSSMSRRVYFRRTLRVVGVVVALLLLLSGDIELNPGPLGLKDLPLLHCELHQVSHKWYSLGVQLQILVGTLKSIESDNNHQTTKCLLEMLTVWLQCTNPSPTWNILIEALESSPVDERLLAQQLRDKYYPKREGGVTHDYHTQGPPPSGALPSPQVQLGRSQGHFLPSQVQTAPLHQSTQSAVSLTQPPVTTSTNFTPPEMTTPPESHMVAHTGGLSSATSGAHGGGGSVESKDGGEELSTPAKCVHEEKENSVSLVSGLGRETVHGESVTPIGIVHHQHHQHPQQHHNHPQQHSHFTHYQAGHSFSHLPYMSVHPVHSSNQTPGNPTLIPPYPPAFPPTPGHPRYHTTGHFQPAYHYPSYQSPLHQLTYPPPYLVLNPSYQAPFHVPVQPLHSYQLQHEPTTHSPSHQRASAFPSTPPPHPHPDSPLGMYASFLKGYYTQHHAPCSKWPQLHTRNYINLAVISNVYAKRKDLAKFRKQTIHGSIDDILEWKAPIRMKNILKPKCADSRETRKQTQFPVTQLLIEGAPGIGKSTFAWEVCHKWGQHQLFNEYFLVVLLKFRDKRVQEAKSVSDLFYYPLPEVQSDIIRDIVLSGGHGLLLILEGFDEAPASIQTMDSIFVRLFTGQELPKATVILTTRPSASAELRQLCNSVNSRRIEIVGFGKKEIDEYIQCAFSDEQSQLDFIEYLSLYPYIHSVMYVPLNSAIVTHVYESCKSSGTVVPKTMTQLYSSLIRTLLLRYLKDKEEYKNTCTNINSFKDLPQPVYDQFCEICKIAYTGIMSAETELIFQDLPSDFDSLGLMQSCPELYVDRGASVSYNFLHLTVQEYLTAYHISQQSRDEQVVFMEGEISDMKVVVRFLAGLTELGTELWDVVRRFASEDCIDLSKEEVFIKLQILHLLFESQDPSAFTSVLGSDCVCFNCDSSLQPFDWYVLGCCISHSICDWKLELNHCELESVELFLKALHLHQDQCQLSSTGKIKKVWLKYNKFEDDPAAVHLLVANMPLLVMFHNLTHLGLVDCDLTSETCNFLSPDSIQLIVDGLSRNTSLEKLDMNHSNFSSENVLHLASVLRVNTRLKELDISSCNIQSSDSVHLAKALEENPTTQLQTLVLGGNPIGSEGAVAFANMLATNKSLAKLNMSVCNIQVEGAVAFASMLRKNQCLKTLNLDDDSVGVEGALELIEGVKHNTTLEELVLSEKCKPPSFLHQTKHCKIVSCSDNYSPVHVD